LPAPLDVSVSEPSNWGNLALPFAKQKAISLLLLVFLIVLFVF